MTKTDSENNIDDFNFDQEVENASNHLNQYLKNNSRSFNIIHNRLLNAGRIEQSNPVMNQNKELSTAFRSSFLYDPSINSAPPLQKLKTKQKKTLGKGWFDLAPAELTEELKRDIRVVQLRKYLDPKRFYKNPDKMNNVLHTGTVIEGPAEYKSARIPRKERKATLVDEILADQKLKSYSKKKFLEIQKEKSNKRKTYKTFKKIQLHDVKPKKKLRI